MNHVNLAKSEEGIINLSDDFNEGRDDSLYQKSKVVAAATAVLFTGVIGGTLGSTLVNASRITDSAYPLPLMLALISFCIASPSALYSVGPCDRKLTNILDYIASGQQNRLGASHQKNKVRAIAAAIFLIGMISGSLGALAANGLSSRITKDAYLIPLIFALSSSLIAIPFATFGVGVCDSQLQGQH